MIINVDYGIGTKDICYDIYTYVKVDDMILTIQDNVMNNRKATYLIT